MANDDQQLIAAAAEAMARARRGGLSTVAAAVRGASGRIHVGANLESCLGPCAETVALGAAVAAGEAGVDLVVAVGDDGRLLTPCGNCRQILVEHAPAAAVLLGEAARPRRVPVADLLPGPYTHRSHAP